MENITKNASITQKPKFKNFLNECELANLSTKERQKYEENLKTYRDWFAYEQTFLQKGEEIGRKKERKTMLEIIQLIYQGKTDEEISEITKINVEEIKEIRNSLKS